jgi:hypothetical protein
MGFWMHHKGWDMHDRSGVIPIVSSNLKADNSGSENELNSAKSKLLGI